MYYFVTFDPKHNAKRRQIVEAYRNFAGHFEKKLPEFEFVGLYARNVLLGSRPHYLAIWEFEEYSDMDKWNESFAKDETGKALANELAKLATGWEAKVMSKLI